MKSDCCRERMRNKDELLEWLEIFYEDCKCIDRWNTKTSRKTYIKQAYNQIKALIQTTTLHIKGTPKDVVELCKEQQKQIGELIKNQPEVPEEQYIEIVLDLYDRMEKSEKNQPKEMSMKDIRSWADGIQEKIKDHEDWSYLEDGIKEMVEEEFGIKVKK